MPDGGCQNVERAKVQHELRPVRPTRPAAAYIGGKRRLAAELVRRIEAVPHTTYAEPFVGMGGVFLRRAAAPGCEVINDISRDVATFFRILQRHYPQFIETLRFQITSRWEFERLMATDPDTLTDLERAARFLYLQRLAYGGKVSGRNFGTDRLGGGRFDVTRLGPLLEEIHLRVAGVVIECLPWAEFLTRYDGPGTLFYLDPPYWGSEDDYGAGKFARRDYAALAAALAGIGGRFILSLNDVLETRELFSRFAIEPVSTRYTVAGGQWAEAKEIIVTGPRRDSVPPPRDLLSLTQ
ncbi:MAG TPA: DNA adenine methylase [Burkholderiales bacterium]|jgi:DNA adenine methylase